MNYTGQSGWISVQGHTQLLYEVYNKSKQNILSRCLYVSVHCASMCIVKKRLKVSTVNSLQGVNYAPVSKVHTVCTHTHTHAHTTTQSPQLAVTPRVNCPNHSKGDKEATPSHCRITAVTADVSPGKELECACRGCMLPEPSRSLAYICKQRNRGGEG